MICRRGLGKFTELYTERIACILCMHLGACRFFMHPTALMHIKKRILRKCTQLHFIFLAPVAHATCHKHSLGTKEQLQLLSALRTAFSCLKFTLSHSNNFYCCKRFLGRNNTTASSAPHQRVPAPFQGCFTALLLRNGLPPLLALLLTSIPHALLTSHASLPGPLYENCHPGNSEHFYCKNRLLGTITISSTYAPLLRVPAP